MLGKNVKLRYGIFVSMLAAITIATGGYFFMMNNAGAEIAGVNASQVSDIVKANAADDTSTDDGTEDAGEVQKDDIVDFHLVATYTGYGNDKSGLVTFTDVLPEYMELVTGNQTVQGQDKDCTPTITNSSGVTWADSNNPYTYDSTTRTFTAQVSGIPASQGADTGNVVDIHLWAKVTEDATSLTTKNNKKVENVYYTNYVTVTHAAASSVSNKVQFHSGNVSDETYSISYRFKDGTTVPAGVQAPTDTSKYGKGSEVTIQPDMKAQGYKFSGWKLVTNGLTTGNYSWNESTYKFVLNTGTTDITEVVFEGEWTENRKIDVNYAWKGQKSETDSTNSDDDKPALDVPQSSNVDEESSIKLPSYPLPESERGSGYDATKDAYSDLYSQYKFIGWSVKLNYSDGTSSDQELSAAEVQAKEFTPKPTSGKTLNSVTITGSWTKTTFTVTAAVEGTDGGVWPDGTTQPKFDDGIKWGTSLTLPAMNPTSGYRFNGWKLEPDLGAGSDSADGGKQYTMPASNVTATASFTKTYKVTMTSATASTSNATEGAEIEAAPGEVVTIKPLQNLEDVRFNEWSTTLTADANNWILNDDNTATFVMPGNDVAITGKYQLEVDFLVVNGKWSDGTTGFKSVFVDVTQQADNSWAGTLADSQVPKDMKADVSHEQNSGGWGDKSTATQNPNNFVGENKITATEGGKANQLTLFTYTFTNTLANITITYNVKAGHEDYGKVTYNETGATAGTKASESVDPLGVKSTPKGATATAKTGYKFAFWSKDNEEDAFSVDANFVPFKVVNTGGTTEFYEKADYYANFEANVFTVKYDSNKGNGSSEPTGTMENQEIAYKSGDKLTANAFKRTGYVFTGWNTAANGSGTAVNDGADGSELSITDGGNVTLYAQWKAQKLTVKFEGATTGLGTNNYCDGSTAQKVFTYDGGEQKLTKNGFKLLGYTFTHWSETNTDEGIKTAFKTDEAVLTNADIAAKCGTNETAEITLYTYWTPLTYTVVFDKNEVAGKSAVEGTTASMTVKYDEMVMLTKNGYTRTGYTWMGWDTDKDKDPSQSTTYADQAYIRNLSETTDSDGNHSVKSSVTLYAIWKVNTYNVQYYGNAVGVTGSMSAQTVNYDETSKVLTNGFRRYGYTFTGWNTQSDGKGTPYAAGDEIKNLVSIANGNFPLYAQWKANDYTVKYDLNDGVQGKDPEAKPSSYEDKIVQWNSRGLTNGKSPTRPGYTFSQWVKKGTTTVVGINTDYFSLRDHTGSDYDDDVNTVITLVAEWTENADITISYEADFSAIPNQQQVGSLNKASETLKPASGTPVGVTAQNITAGYKVKEWRVKGVTGDDGKVQDGGNNFVPKKNSDYIYEAKTYVAVFDVDIAKYKVKYYQEQADGTWSEVSADAQEFEKHSNEVPDYSATDFNTGGTLAKTYDGYSATPAVKYWSNTAKGTDGRGTDTVQNVQPDGSLEIRAYYPRNTYNITFDTRGHGAVTNPTENTGLRWGNKVTKPTDPVEAGWTFGGWFKEQACTNAWNFDTLTTDANGSFTLFAKWTQNTYTVKYEAGKGATNSTAFTDKTGVTWAQASLLPSAAPLRKGYTFKNWTVSGDNENRVASSSSTYSALVGYANGDDKTASITLKANYEKDAKDNTGTKTGNVTVYANDIRMSVEEATALLAKNNASQLSDILAKSDAFAEQDDETPVAITQLSHTIKTQAGQYTFTLSTATGASVTAKAFVYDTTTTTGKAAIGAQNFRVSVEQVTQFNLNNSSTGKQNLINLAHARAWNTDTRADIGIASVTTTVAATEGVYDVTFVSSDVNGSTATIIVKCTVYSKGKADQTYQITANDFAVKKSTTVEDADLISLGNAKAYEVSTGNEVEVTVNKGTFDSAKVGQYTITYSVKGVNNGPTQDVTATVYDDAVEKDGEVISANGFSIAKTEVTDALTDAKLIELANAKAYEKATGKSVTVSVKDRGGLKAEKGTYKVTFKTAKGTETTVDVKVTDNETTKNGIRISANDFTISVDEVKTNILKNGNTPDNDALISYAKASATKVSDGSDVGIGSVTSTPAIAAKKGTYVLTFTSKELDGSTAVTNCKMTVNDNSGIQKGIRLDANDFTVSVEQVQEESLSGDNANLANLIKRAKATASLEADGTAVPITAATSHIEAAKGTYDVIFTATYGDNTTQATIQVTVTDKSGESDNPDSPDAIKIDANAFALSVAEATTLAGQAGDTQKKALIDYAQAKASKISDGSEIEVSEATTTVQGKKGEYTATFKAVNNGQTAEITVNVKVVESAIRDNNDVDIFASGFRVTAKEVTDNKLNDSTKGLQALIKYANASAVLKKDQSNVGIASVESHIRAEKGTYDVKFTSNVPAGGTAATITVKAQVTDNQTVTEDGLTISANNFTVSVKEAKTLGATNPDKDKLIQLANAHAEDSTGASIGIASVTSTIEPKVGTYKVRFTSNTVNEKRVSQEVTATVRDGSAKSDTIKLNANDFTVSVDEVNTHKLNSNTDGKDKLIEFAHAHAELLSDGTFVEIASVNSLIEPKVGTYDVEFTTAAPTGTTAISLKVKAKVVSSAVDPNPGDKDGVRAYATDFSISKADVETLKLHERPLTDTVKNKLIELAKARAEKVLDGSEVAIDKTAITSEIVNAKGKYKVTFTSASVNEKTATAVAWAQVTDDSNSGEITDPDNPDKINLSANNFDMSIADAEALNKLGNDERLAKLIEFAKANAYLESDGSAVDIISATGTINAEKGRYKVTFKTATIKNTSVELSVWATVNTSSSGSEEVDDPNKPGAKDKINIYASDFSVSINDVKNDNLGGTSANLDNLIARAKARAEMASDGRAVKVASVTSAIEAAKGTYDVTFTTEAVSEKTASITIKATVTDNTGESGEITDPDPDRPSGADKINIYANDFSVSVKDVTAKSLDNGGTALADLIKLANARAEWASDGVAIDVVKAESEIKATKGTYKVTFTSKEFKNSSASVSIWATVTDDSGSSGEIVDPNPTDPDNPRKDTINIYANNFTISAKDVKFNIISADGYNNDALIAYAKARATLQSDGSDFGIAKVETAMQAEKGTYDVKFTSNELFNKSATITIKATVTDGADSGEEVVDPDLPDPKPEPGGPDYSTVRINAYANDFSVSVKDVEQNSLTDNDAGKAKLIELANARAEYSKDGSNVAIVSVNSKIEAKKGTYTVEFTSEAKGNVPAAEVSITATVTDNSASGEEVVDPDLPDPKPNPGDPDYSTVRINAYANDFTVSANDVETGKLNDNTAGKDKLIELAKARAEYSKDGSNVTIASVDSKIEAKKGTYTVKFTSEAKGNVPAAEIIVNATVTDSAEENSGKTDDGKTDGVRAYANNFTVSVKEVEDGNLGDVTATGVLDKLVKYAGAKAERVLDGSAVDIASATSSIVAKKGEYDVTFTSAEVANKTATVSVKARVVDYADRGDVTNPDNPNPDPDRSDKISIYANDFTIAKSEVESIYNGSTTVTLGVATALIKKADARAELISDQSNVEIATVETDMSAQRGTYDVKFTTQAVEGKHASVTVKATVTDNGETGNSVDIFANDFTVSVAEVKADKLTDGSETGGMASLIKRAGAHARDKYGKAVDIVKVESSILAKGGKYDVVFTSAEVNGDAIKVKIRATVKDSATEDAEAAERIAANNFSLSMEEATAIVNGTTSEADAKTMLINLANAEASNIADGSPVAITEVDYTALKAEVANYKIKFATAKGTSVTVLAKVSDSVVVVGNVAVDAHDFTVSVAEVNNLNLDDGDAGKDNLVSLAQAKAWDTNTKEPIEFSKVTSAIEAKRGTYDVEFEATNGTDTNSIVVKASVRDKKVDPSNPDPKPDPDPDNPDKPKPDPDPDQPTPGPDDTDVDIVMYANDFAVSIQEVNEFNLTDGDASLDKLVELADVIARKHSDNNPVKIAKATSSIKAVKGDYTVEFETEAVDDKTLKMEVNARVLDTSSVTPDPTDPDNSVVMYASDFMSWREEAEAIVKGTVIGKDSILKAFADGPELNEGQKELVRLGAVVAYNTKDNSEVDITDVTFPYDSKTGDYAVTFVANTGKVTAKLTVTNTVTDEGTENTENKERIFANNISYTYAEAEALLSQSNNEIATQLARDAKACAVSTEDWSDVDVTDAQWDIQAAEGVYNVTFSTEKGTTVRVKANVGEKPLDPSALSALSKTGDNVWKYIVLAVMVVLISAGVIYALRKRRS